ncbi:ABC transporter ATP-binding protein [Leadbetterella sp. DM7]|uniref:ABC transporter ATP-binding protein n=1 Tax=Leadbetterella sp. DM7 TaxID=3235085 RepID=UPI00349E6435
MLRSQKLTYSYGDTFSLKPVSLRLNHGEITGIIGHSGSGKSTLLHLLAGLKEPASGQILLNGEPILTPSKKLVPGHEKIKLVTQQNTLFPHINIAENIAYELRYYEKGYQKTRVNALARALNLRPLLGKLPRELSGGEIQRVMIARALADEPLVLLLDEPMANLDRIHKKKIMLSLAEVVRQEQIACAMVTHDIYDAFGMAGRLVIMDRGRILQNATSEDIYFRPRNRYVAELTGEVNEWEAGHFFRPEAVVFSPEGPWEGTVRAVVFQGSHYDIVLDTANGPVSARSEERLENGKRYTFGIRSFIHFD